jgi:hypothetical protein
MAYKELFSLLGNSNPVFGLVGAGLDAGQANFQKRKSSGFEAYRKNQMLDQDIREIRSTMRSQAAGRGLVADTNDQKASVLDQLGRSMIQRDAATDELADFGMFSSLFQPGKKKRTRERISMAEQDIKRLYG